MSRTVSLPARNLGRGFWSFGLGVSSYDSRSEVLGLRGGSLRQSKACRYGQGLKILKRLGVRRFNIRQHASQLLGRHSRFCLGCPEP